MKEKRLKEEERKEKDYEIHIYFNGIFFLLLLKIQVPCTLGKGCFHPFLFFWSVGSLSRDLVSEIKPREWEVWQDWEQCCHIAGQKGKVRSHIKVSYAEDVGKGAFEDCWWQSTVVHPLWKWAWRFLRRTKNRSILYDQAMPCLIIHLRESKSAYLTGPCLSRFIITLFIIAKLWNHPRHLPTDEWIK